MKQPCLWLLPLVLTQSFGLEADLLPRKSNIVSNYLDKVLTKLFAQLATSQISIPEINLGAETGKFTDVEIKTLENGKRTLDGVQSYGFKLNMTLTKFIIAGNYDLIHLDVPGLFPFFGKGKFSIMLDSVELNMKLTALFDAAENKFNIDIPDFQIVLENSTVEFENLMDDTHLADFLNELFSNLLPDIIKTISKPLIEMAKPLIDYYGNGIIKCIKTGIFLGTTEKCIKDLFFPPEIGDEHKLSTVLSKYLKFGH